MSKAGLPQRTCAVEFNLDALVAAAPRGGEVMAISSFPVAKEDVALVVDKSVAAEDVRQALIEGAGPLLESVELFDVYEGEQVGDNRKSLAFNLRLRGADRTLTDSEALETCLLYTSDAANVVEDRARPSRAEVSSGHRPPVSRAA